MADLKPFFALSRLRVVLFLREPEAVFWTFVFPLVLAVVLGVAFRSEQVVTTPIGVLEVEGSALAERFADLEGAEVIVYRDREEAQRALFRSRIDALVQPGAPLEVSSHPGRAEGEVARLRLLRHIEKARRIAAPDEPPSAIEIPLDRRGTRYLDFLFPGLIGMNLMGTGVWGVGFSLAEMRQKRLIRRFLVTPMPRSHFLLSFVSARMLFLVLELSILVTFGILALDIPFAGSLVAFVSLATLGGISFAGLGLLIASRARTIEGVSGLMNVVLMPMWLASGVFFSYERFPEVIQPLLKVLPLTALNDGLRAIMLEGGGLVDAVPSMLILAGWSVLCFLAAMKLFRWD